MVGLGSLDRVCVLFAAVAAGLLSACSVPGVDAVQGSLHGSGAHAYAPDTHCQVGLLFLRDYDRVTGTLGLQVDAARENLNAAHDEASSRAALQKLAGVLDSFDSALGALEAPPAESSLLASVVASGGDLAREARVVAGQPAGSRDVAAFDAAVQMRTASIRALSLRVTLLRSECA